MDDSARRPLIGLGVAVAVVITLFLVSALHANDDAAGCSADQRDRWRARLLRAEPVTANQLGGCTSARGLFTFAACELRIAAGDARSRSLVINALDALELKLDIDADGRPMKLRATLDAGERKELFLGKEAQTLALHCLTGSTCRARLE